MSQHREAGENDFKEAMELPPLPNIRSDGTITKPKVIYLARKLQKADSPEKREDIMADLDEIQSDVPVHRGTFSLNTTKTYAREWTLRDMQREFFQNLLDETILKNGRGTPSYRGVRVATGTRTNGRKKEEVTVIYNQEYRLAEVVFTPSQTEGKCSLRFINYGTTPHGGRSMLRYGTTNKRGMSNQIGKYGEGAKRSIAICVNHGITVDILAYVKETTRLTCQHWVFKDLGKNDIRGSITPIRPAPYYGDGDELRFEVKLLACKSLMEQLRFDIDHFLVPRQYLVDEEEWESGVVLPSDQNQGDIYVHHFYVISLARPAFGYDFFMNIHRDRSSIPSHALLEAIAAAWDTAIEKELPIVHELMAYLADEQLHKARSCELDALKHLSASSKEFLAMLWGQQHPDCYPETHAQEARNLALDGKLVPNQVYEMLVTSTWSAGSFRIPSNSFMAKDVELVDAHNDDVASVLAQFPMSIQCFQSRWPLKYFKRNQVLYVNVEYLPDDGEETNIDLFALLFSIVVPRFFPNTDLTPTLKAYIQQQQQPVVNDDSPETEEDNGPIIILDDSSSSSSSSLSAATVPPLRIRVKRPIMEQWVDAPDQKRIKLQWFARSEES